MKTFMVYDPCYCTYHLETKFIEARSGKSALKKYVKLYVPWFDQYKIHKTSLGHWIMELPFNKHLIAVRKDK